MSEPITAFVSRRRPEWDALQALLARLRAGKLQLSELERLDQLYRHAAADLARAQAQYPSSEAHRFLNQLCTEAYGAIYQPPRDRLNALRRFFRLELPRTLRAHLRYVGLSALLLLLGALAGALVVLLEPRGAELLVPENLRDYIAQKRMWTEDLFRVTPPGIASSRIWTNNVTVLISAFAFGLSGGIGTALLLLMNGLMLGSVAALCVRGGTGWLLLDFIGAHGFVELSLIVIAGGAGLMLGHALIDPGELPRSQALQRRGREAVKLVLGAAPFLVGIGFVEGYVSPSALPLPFKVGLGALLGAALWSYLLLTGREARRG